MADNQGARVNPTYFMSSLFLSYNNQAYNAAKINDGMEIHSTSLLLLFDDRLLSVRFMITHLNYGFGWHSRHTFPVGTTIIRDDITISMHENAAKVCGQLLSDNKFYSLPDAGLCG